MAFFYVFKWRWLDENPRRFEDEAMMAEAVFEEARRAPKHDAEATLPPSLRLLNYFESMVWIHRAFKQLCELSKIIKKK